jgi:hypothetical protein
MRNDESLLNQQREDFASLLSRRAHPLLERMAREIEGDEAKSALSRLLALTTAAGDCAEAEAIQTAMHWAPAVVAGNITERELMRRLDWVVWPELMAAAVANYREILCNTARRWAGAILNGYATEKTVVEELGIPPDIVSATVNEYKRAYGTNRGVSRRLTMTPSNSRTAGYLAKVTVTEL